GPKAVSLRLIASAQSTEQPQQVPERRSNTWVTLYVDPASEFSPKALAEIRAVGIEPRVVDYIATPPTSDELRTLSVLARDGDQSLVRRQDPLFHDLQLDDRFLGANEFWAAIAEHPSLINGPIVRTATSAGICRSEGALRSVLVSAFPWLQAALQPQPEPEPVPVKQKAVPSAPSEDAKSSKTKAVRKKDAKTPSPARKKATASAGAEKRPKKAAKKPAPGTRARKK